MRNRILFPGAAALVALIFSAIPQRVNAQIGGGVVVCTNCASDITAGAQLAKETTTALQAAQMVTMMTREAMALAKNPSPNMLADLGMVSSLVGQSGGIVGDAAQMNAAFRGTYSPYDPTVGASFANTYNKWSTTALRTINGSIAAGGYQSQMLQNEQAWISLMQALSGTPMGADASLQLNNSIGTGQIQQLEALRQMTATNAAAQGAFMANQINTQQVQQNAQRAAFAPLNWTADGRQW